MKINEIYLGDCLELMPKYVEDKSIDLIFSLLHFQRSTALSQIHCSLIVKENGRQIKDFPVKTATS